jgi:thiosulfate/3-mercaptopyruvate sulfurtransferase
LEPWEKVLIDAAAFPRTDHGEIPCIDCHGGDNHQEKEEAHLDLIARPSEKPQLVCQECHKQEVESHQFSLHTSQQGYWTVLEARGASVQDPAMQEMFGNHCASCHTSCGDCHVSQPASVGGGLLESHIFTSDPPMTRTCTACHGSRIGNEFLGKYEDVRADVHFRQGRMTCVECHTGNELHGQPIGSINARPAHRYESGVESPRCEDCHLSAVRNDEIESHDEHIGTLSCQVCHSVSYINCDGCHVAVSETTNNPFFETSDAYMTFQIGRNPIQSEDRPYEYVPLRHVPVDPQSFAHYGEDLLPDFNSQPTWRYATPHNIQRETPQTESCNSCHGNAELFLTADKINPEELEANSGVVVNMIPKVIPDR